MLVVECLLTINFVKKQTLMNFFEKILKGGDILQSIIKHLYKL